jgi:fructoselysine 6-kinase
VRPRRTDAPRLPLQDVSGDAISSIAVAGDACIDVYLDPPTPFSAVGGNGVNVAVGLAGRSVRSAFFGVVGDDANGDRIRAQLRSTNVAVSGVRTVGGPSWVAYIARSERGTATVAFEEPGGVGLYRPLSEELDALTAFDHVHLVNLADPAQTLGQLADRGVSTSYDFAHTDPDGTSAPMEVAFFSRPEATRQEAEEIARFASGLGARLAIVTLGERGSIAVDGEQVFILDAEPIEPVDTLGAGDSFIAAFLAARLTGVPLARALEVARDHATRTCLHWAAWPQQQIPANGVPADRG